MTADEQPKSITFILGIVFFVVLCYLLCSCGRKNYHSKVETKKEFTGEQLASLGIDPKAIDLTQFGINIIKVDSNRYISTQQKEVVITRGPKKVFIHVDNSIKSNSDNKVTDKSKDKSKVKDKSKTKIKVKDKPITKTKTNKSNWVFYMILFGVIIGICALAWRFIKRKVSL